MLVHCLVIVLVSAVTAKPAFDLFGLTDLLVDEIPYSEQCPRYFARNGESCLRVIDSFHSGYWLNWAQADQYCTFYERGTYRSHLVSIDNDQELEFVKGLLPPGGSLARNYWVSANTVDPQREWVWAPRGRNVSITNWAPDEPQPGQDRNCMALWGAGQYNSVATQCYNYLPFICEVELD